MKINKISLKKQQPVSEYGEIGNLALKRIQKKDPAITQILDAFIQDWPKLADKQKNNLLADVAYYSFDFGKPIAEKFNLVTKHLTESERISLINKMIVSMQGRLFDQRSLKGLNQFWDELLQPVWRLRLQSGMLSQEEQMVFIMGMRYLRGQRLLEACKMAIVGPQIKIWHEDLNKILIILRESYKDWIQEPETTTEKLARKKAVLNLFIYVFKDLHCFKENKNYSELNKDLFNQLIETIHKELPSNNEAQLLEEISMIIKRVHEQP